MADPVSDPLYWAKRLAAARAVGDPEWFHHAVFRCPPDRWAAIGARHRGILATHVGKYTSVLDCGCGYGRLLDLMPQTWRGRYLGLDVSPDMVGEARARHPGRAFRVADLRDLSGVRGEPYNVAVLCSVRPMVRRNLGDETWATMESQIRTLARRLLYLEYDPDDPGSLE